MTVMISILASGSRGNATFIKTNEVRLLIDAGLSRKEIAKRLTAIGEDPDGIDAVVVTHEHNDHVAGLRMLLKDLSVTAYMTQGTMDRVPLLEQEDGPKGGQRRCGVPASNVPPKLVVVAPGVPFSIGDVQVTPFSVPHDAAQPVAFSVTCGGVKISQLTDAGYLPDAVAEQLRGSHVLILESNHDVEMLRVGPYPWNLKQRLMGRHGHLSNSAVSRFIRDRYDGQAQHFLLAHLSSKNNHPELARQETLRALQLRGLKTESVMVTAQDLPTAPIRL